MLYSTTYASLVGPLTLAGDGENLVGLWMEGDRYFSDTIAGRPVTENKELPLFATVKNWLDAYFAGERPAISALPLAPAGTPFQKLVYDTMRDIPYGQCTTYGAGRRGRAQPHFHHHPLPSGRGGQRQPDRIRGRHPQKNTALAT